jgi:hypothetical protein
MLIDVLCFGRYIMVDAERCRSNMCRQFTRTIMAFRFISSFNKVLVVCKG